MRSLSNLYKQCYVLEQTDQTRIINSNTVVNEKLEQLAREYAKKNQLSAGDGIADADGFTAGLAAETVEIEPEVDYVEEAKAEAEQILANARTQADTQLADARAQVEQILEDARVQGYDRGSEEARQQAKEQEQRQQQQYQLRMQQLEEEYNDRFLQMEPRLLDTMLQIMDEVFHIQYEDKQDILLHLITNAVMNVEGCKEFQIRVCREDYAYLEEHRQELIEQLPSSVSIDILVDMTLQKNECMIETPVGVFDCGTVVQMENLIKDLKSLCPR